MSIKQRTLTGLFWSFIDSGANIGISFVVGIILARILSPKEFGLIGMLTIFIAISQSFIDSGFRQALIRKPNCSQADYSTVFLFSIGVSVFFYLALYFSAGHIANFFKEGVLEELIRVLALCLIINSFAVIHSAILTKDINFKLPAKISLIASILSGGLSIYMAYHDWGVWSLVASVLMRSATISSLMWVFNTWRPSFIFSIQSFRELFSFGGKLMVSGLIDTIYRNAYYIFIGKFFSATQLGYYTRADQFQALPSSNLQGIIGSVSYPALLTMQDDIPRLREAYKKTIRSTMLITFVLMLGLAAVARPMILSLIGEKWEQSIIYLQLLCFVGMFYPLHALNLNMLQVQGRSGLFLRLEIIKKILSVPIILVGLMWGLEAMIISMIVNSLIAYYLNSYWSGEYIGYSFYSQVRDIVPSFAIASTMAIFVHIAGLIISAPPLAVFIIQVILGAIITFVICEGFRNKDYLYIKEIVIGFLRKNRI